MSAFLLALAEIFGPILLKWLESMFKKAAKKLPADATPEQVVEASIETTRGPFRKALLRALKPHANNLAAGQKLSKAQKNELLALAGQASKE